jgi:2-polyprenyl-3-methyl-5-hydroxy-6-metoxy-1,4-benzoquinol methylase
MKNKKLKAIGNTAEDYDRYFDALQSCDRHYLRSVYRAIKGISLLETRNGNVLSIGVGNLGEARELKKAGFDVAICDISAKAIEYAKKEGFNSFVCDITSASPQGCYNYIFALEVLEHLVNPLLAIQNLKIALKDSGTIVISLPNEFNIWARLMIMIGFPPFGGHDWHHLRFFSRKFGEKLFVEAGLKIIKKTYCPLLPLQWSQCCGEFLQRLWPNLFSLTTIWSLKK